MKSQKLFFSLLLTPLSIGAYFLSLTGCTPVTRPERSVNAQPQVTQAIKISGSGSVYPAFQVVATAYEAKDKNTKITFLPPNQTEGGIAGVKHNIVELGALGRELKPEENNGKIIYRELAKDALLVATHPSVKGVKNLQTKDLKAIYSGVVTNWQAFGGPDAKIIVLDRPEDETAKKLLRKYYLGKNLKTTTQAVLLSQESELIRALQDTPYSIGAFSLAYATANKLTVNRLSLDGVEPIAENVKTGKYKMVRNIGIVAQKSLTAPTKEFLNFAFSKEAAAELQKSGFVPATSQEK